MTQNADKKFMQRALRLAERGRGAVSPNPMVGCIVTKGNRIVAEGWHRAFGGPHAEVVALDRAGQRAQGATLYVTLEPCSHWGKTPPCAPAIVKAGIKRVVAAMRDPHKQVSGQGFGLLRRKGLRVELGVLEKEARFLNRAFVKLHEIGLPYLIYKAGQTLDGKIASRTGRSRWITGPEARNCGHRLRTQSDAIWVGANTVRQDDPELTSHGLGPNPLRIVISKNLELLPKARIFREGAPTWVITGTKSPSSRVQKLEQAGAQILRFPLKNGSFDLKEILSQLAKLGISQILLEGGGETSFHFFEQGLVDEVYMFMAPRFLGGRAAPSSISGTGWSDPQKGPNLSHADFSKVGNDFLIHGFVDTRFTRSLF